MAATILLPQMDVPRCTGCGWCVGICPPHVLSLQTNGWRKHAVLHDAPGCTGCRKCERHCPFGVISMATTDQLGQGA